MKAHICTIGDEILIGQINNTNAAYIAQQLTELQITVSGISTVGDDESEIIKEFERVWKNNDLLIVTGGLGPTHDDITRECIAKFFGQELIMDESVLNDLKAYFNKRGREMSPSNEQQALVLKGADVIRNLCGTAPGTWFSNTIFIIIADHNGDSAGKDDLPVWRYKIPCIVYAPEMIKPQVVNKLSSQIDVMPTLFSLLHWSYDSKFYGQNILSDDFKERAFIGTYQLLGLLREGRLTELRPDKTVKEYKIEDQTLLTAKYTAVPVVDRDRFDAVTYYQSASYSYKNHKDRWPKTN